MSLRLADRSTSFVYGAGDGTTDDSNAFAGAISSASQTGRVGLLPGKSYYLPSGLSVPQSIYIVGSESPGDLIPTWNTNSITPKIVLGSGTTISMATGSGLQGVAVTRHGIDLNPANMRTTLTNNAAFAGTGITLSSVRGVVLRDLFLLGHALGISCSSSPRFHFRNIIGDCTAGISIDEMHDVSELEDVEFTACLSPASGGQFPSISVTGAADNGSGLIRLTFSDTSSLQTGDLAWVVGVGGTIEANGRWTITVIDGTHVDLQSSTFSNVWTSGGSLIIDTTYRSGVAFQATNVDNLRFVNCFEYGHEIGYYFSTAAQWCNLVNCGCDGYGSTSKDPNPIGIKMDSTSGAASFMGGWTASKGTSLSYAASGLPSSFHGVSFSGNGGGPSLVDISAGSCSLIGCGSQSTTPIKIGSSITSVSITNGHFANSALTFASAPAATKSIVSGFFASIVQP